MTQGKKEGLLDYIKRIGSKAYAQEATDVKIKSQQRRDFKKTGQYYFNITPMKEKAVDLKKVKRLKLKNQNSTMMFTKMINTLSMKVIL
jgi:hypothetical protein